MTDLSLRYLLYGEDKTATATIDHVGGAFTKMGAAIGGEFGEVLGKIGEGVDKIGEHGKGVAKTIGTLGATATGIGLLLQHAASKDIAAHQQLVAAIKASGHAYGDYKDDVEKAIKTGEHFGYTADQTQNALQRLTQSTNDPRIALERMTLAENLAAAQHIGLVEAAAKISAVYGGSSKVLKQFGINMDSAKQANSQLTSAQNEQSSAVKKLHAAQQALSDLHVIYAAKTHLSTAQTIALRKAFDALHAAEADVKLAKTTTDREAALKRVATAQQRLNDLQAIDADKKNLSVSEALHLQHATEKARDAAAALTAANAKLASAQTHAKAAAKSQSEALDTLAAKTAGQANAQANTFTGTVNAWKAHLTDMVSSAGQSYGAIVTQVGAVASAVAIFDTGFGGLAKKLGGGIWRGLGSGLSSARLGFMYAADATKRGAAAALEFVVAQGKAVLVNLRSAIVTAASTTATIAQTAASMGAAAATKAWAAVQWLLNAALDANPIGLIVLGIAALVAGIVLAYKHSATFRAIVQGAFHAVAAAFEFAWDKIKAGFDWLRDHWKLVLSILTGPIGAAVIFITTHWDQIVGYIKGLPGRISSVAHGMWDGIKESFRAAINWLIDKWNDFHLTLGGGSILGMSIPSVTLNTPDIPHLALGGIVRRPTLIVAGDGPGPEAIVPLSRAGGSLGGGDIHVHLHGNFLGGPRQIALAVEAALAQLKRERGTKLAFA